MKLPNNIYDILKWISLICLPAFSTFLSVVLSALNVDPSVVNVVTTIISATGVLIGTLIGVSTHTYNKGGT